MDISDKPGTSDLMEFALLIDLCTSSQTELFFQLIDPGNSREKVNLASSDLVELTGTFVPLTLRRLGFLEVDKDWKTFAGEEIPIFEGGVRPSVGPTDDYIFSGVCQFSAKTRFELKAGVIKNEAKSVRLDNKKRREQQRKTAQHDTQQRCLEDSNEEHPVGGKADGNVVVGIHHNIGDLALGDSLFRFSATAEHAVEQVLHLQLRRRHCSSRRSGDGASIRSHMVSWRSKRRCAMIGRKDHGEEGNGGSVGSGHHLGIKKMRCI